MVGSECSERSCRLPRAVEQLDVGRHVVSRERILVRVHLDPVLRVHRKVPRQVVNVDRVLARVELWEFRP